MAATSTPAATVSPGTWSVVAAVEATAAVVAVALDLFVVTFVLLALTAVSLLVRRQGLPSLGVHTSATPHLALKMLGFAVVWSLFQLSVTLPLASHVSGTQQDLSAFDDLQGNVPQLVLLLVLSWTLAAFGEELAYRGYLFTRIGEGLGNSRFAVALAVAVSSVMFGFAHTEQGVIGVVVVTLDAAAWCALRLRFDTLWAPILAHGFNNTLGFAAFFLVGPVHGFW